MAAIPDHALHNVADEVLSQFHNVIELGIGNFRLHHPELSQVAARLGFFRAERRPKRIDLAQRHGGGFNIKLARLRKERVFIKIFHRKKRGGAFTRRGRKDGRISQREAAIVKEIARRSYDLRAYAQDGCLPGRANPKMPVLHEKVGAVFFARNGKRLIFRNALEHLHVVDVKLESAGARLSARTLPVTITLDSSVRFLRVSKTSGVTWFLGTTP